jgi:preprotein translocase subunit SecE
VRTVYNASWRAVLAVVSVVVVIVMIMLCIDGGRRVA